MHYSQPQLNVLLRSLPAPPAARRLFFSMVVAWRRRLAKRWEQTPLARLFALEDEWALFKLEAQRMWMLETIRAKGLLPHVTYSAFMELLCPSGSSAASATVAELAGGEEDHVSLHEVATMTTITTDRSSSSD